MEINLRITTIIIIGEIGIKIKMKMVKILENIEVIEVIIEVMKEAIIIENMIEVIVISNIIYKGQIGVRVTSLRWFSALKYTNKFMNTYLKKCLKIMKRGTKTLIMGE